MTKAVVGELCQISAFTQFKIKTRGKAGQVPQHERYYTSQFPFRSLRRNHQIHRVLKKNGAGL